jgi:hypothetical protein
MASERATVRPRQEGMRSDRDFKKPVLVTCSVAATALLHLNNTVILKKAKEINDEI